MNSQPETHQYTTAILSGPTIPVLFALSTAPDLATGLERLGRFAHLFGPMRLLVNQTALRFCVRVSSDELSVPLPPRLAATQLVFLHERVQSLAVRPFAPLTVSMPLPRAERETMVDVFGQIPTWGEATLHYRPEDARIPFISDNDDLWQATEANLIAATRLGTGQSTFTERVRNCFLEAFSIDEPSLAHVCNSLNVSRTTLIRKLRAEGTSFQELLENTRRTLAIRYLTRSELTNQQIAHLVGYVDPNAFQRAFKRWTGSTPQSVRQGQMY